MSGFIGKTMMKSKRKFVDKMAEEKTVGKRNCQRWVGRLEHCGRSRRRAALLCAFHARTESVNILKNRGQKWVPHCMSLLRKQSWRPSFLNQENGWMDDQGDDSRCHTKYFAAEFVVYHPLRMLCACYAAMQLASCACMHMRWCQPKVNTFFKWQQYRALVRRFEVDCSAAWRQLKSTRLLSL